MARQDDNDSGPGYWTAQHQCMAQNLAELGLLLLVQLHRLLLF